MFSPLIFPRQVTFTSSFDGTMLWALRQMITNGWLVEGMPMWPAASHAPGLYCAACNCVWKPSACLLSFDFIAWLKWPRKGLLTLIWLRMVCVDSALVKQLGVLQPEPLCFSAQLLFQSGQDVPSVRGRRAGFPSTGQDTPASLLRGIWEGSGRLGVPSPANRS